MKRDILGRATNRAAERMVGVKKRVLDEFPLGPSNVAMKPSEARRFMSQGSPEQVAAYLQRLTPENLGVLMGGNEPNLFDLMGGL